MKRKDFIVSSALGTVALGTGQVALAEEPSKPGNQARSRKILIAGGGFDHRFIGYMASLTGKDRPRL